MGRGMIDLLGAGITQPVVWSQTAGGTQNWTTAANWSDGAIPNPTSGTTMDFSSVNILADTTLNLGANRTAQLWKFGDTSGTQSWIVSAGNTITLAGTTPTMEVTNNTTRLDNVVAGSAGIAKTGAGTLSLNGTNTYTGATTLSGGTLRLANTAAVTGSSLLAIGGNRLEIATNTAFSGPAITSQLGTIVSDRTTAGAGLTHVLGNATIGNGLSNFTAGTNVTSGIAAIQLGNVTNDNGSTATPGLNPTTANLIITGKVT